MSGKTGRLPLNSFLQGESWLRGNIIELANDRSSRTGLPIHAASGLITACSQPAAGLLAILADPASPEQFELKPDGAMPQP